MAGPLRREGPRLINLETTRRCNLSCPMCGRAEPSAHAGQDMSPEVFRRVLPLMDGCETVWLSGYGEPLLLPHLPDWVRACKEAGALATSFTTNGFLLDEERGERLVAAGLDRLQLSYEGEGGLGHGSRPDVARQVRARVEAFVARFEGPARPEILVAFVLMASNLDELVPVVEWAAAIGATLMTVQPFRPPRRELRGENVLRHPDALRRALDEARSRAETLGLDLQAQFMDFALDPRPRPCDFPERFMHVAWDGGVYMCCAGLATGANVLEEDPRTIWTGRAYEELRARLRRGDPPASCRDCPIVRLDVASLERDLGDVPSFWRRLRRKRPVEIVRAVKRRWLNWWRRG